MNRFIARFQDQIQGTLSGFDGVVLRGSLRRLTHSQGMKMYLMRNQVLCKQYLDHVRQVSQDLKEASLRRFDSGNFPSFTFPVLRRTRSRSRARSRRSARSMKAMFAL
jgi:hypothetical protein